MTVEPGVGTRAEDRGESDACVIERSRDEPEAFAALYDRHADAVHRYAARRLGPEAAEDLMAETRYLCSTGWATDPVWYRRPPQPPIE